MKYKVKITETLERTVEVEADSETGAMMLVDLRWSKSDYVLDSTDFTGVNFNIVNEPDGSDYDKTFWGDNA